MKGGKFMNYETPSMTIYYLEVECTLGDLVGRSTGTVDTEGNTDIDNW